MMGTETKVVLELTPDEAEQTLRALNRVGMTGASPYLEQGVLLSSAIKLSDAMEKAKQAKDESV